jgi:hypothetical protein
MMSTLVILETEAFKKKKVVQFRGSIMIVGPGFLACLFGKGYKVWRR